MLVLSQLFYELQCNGFKKKNSALFRVYGDGILQTVKFEKRIGSYGEVYIGLQSMYAELLQQWFTAKGCIPRYPAVNIIGQRWGSSNAGNGDRDSFIDYQREILCKNVLPWFNEMLTQRQMVDGLCYLESSWGGHIIWNDSMKIAPYLACKDFKKAEKVILAILDQHKFAYRQKRQLLTNKHYNDYIEKHSKEDEKLENLLRMIQSGDCNSIKAYLHRNYLVNVKYAKNYMYSGTEKGKNGSLS